MLQRRLLFPDYRRSQRIDHVPLGPRQRRGLQEAMEVPGKLHVQRQLGSAGLYYAQLVERRSAEGSQQPQAGDSLRQTDGTRDERPGRRWRQAELGTT